MLKCNGEWGWNTGEMETNLMMMEFIKFWESAMQRREMWESASKEVRGEQFCM